ncbi:MAG: hypothetical protein WD845_14095 [Pirellulales bacterium]
MRHIILGLSLGLVAITDVADAAITASGNQGNPTTVTQHDGNMGNGFAINEDVAFDTSGGPWVKQLVNAGGGISSGVRVDITETFTNTGLNAWTGWHEQIISVTDISGPQPGFLFDEDSLVVSLDAGGGFQPLSAGVDYSVVATDYTGPGMGVGNVGWQAVSIFFEPHSLVHAGDALRIDKQIFEVFLDVNIWPTGEAAEIAQYPTVPEPSAWVLAALGLAIVLPRARRRSKGEASMRTARHMNHNRVRTALSTWILVLAAFATLCWPATASAEIVFDTFGPGDSYDEDFKYSGGSFQFQPTESGSLKSIAVALGRPSTETTQTNFGIVEEVDLNVFILLESWVIPNETPPLPSPGAVVSFDSVVQPTLLVGHSYWLSMDSSFPGSLWFFNDQGIVGKRSGSDIISTLPAFRVEVVPEPSAGSLLVVGVLLLAVVRAWRSSAEVPGSGRAVTCGYHQGNTTVWWKHLAEHKPDRRTACSVFLPRLSGLNPFL